MMTTSTKKENGRTVLLLRNERAGVGQNAGPGCRTQARCVPRGGLRDGMDLNAAAVRWTHVPTSLSAVWWGSAFGGAQGHPAGAQGHPAGARHRRADTSVARTRLEVH